VLGEGLARHCVPQCRSIYESTPGHRANVAVAQHDLLFRGPHTGYDLSRNGTIVTLRPGSADAEVIVVTNWIAALKAKLGKK
jgi:hypothetical protein